MADPVQEIGLTPFHLAYADIDERPLQERLAAFYRQKIPGSIRRCPLPNGGRPPQGSKIRIAIASQYLHEHTLGRLTSGWIRHLDRNRFHVTVVRFGPPPDAMAAAIDRSADAAVQVSRHLSSAREEIAGLEFDVILYVDVGMDAFPISWRLPVWRRCSASLGGIR